MLVLAPKLNVHAQSQNAGSSAAVASEAATVQPKIPARLPIQTPQAKKNSPVTTPQGNNSEIDPLLDPSRPKNCQLTIDAAQSITNDNTTITLPPGTYSQISVMEGPEGRKAIEGTELKNQAVGLGYIRYFSDAKLKIGGQDRQGGIDVGIRATDNLPLRIWYKKMVEPDDWTKAFTFIFPPVGLIAGAGAWSSGNIIIPNQSIVYSEARDYYLKTAAQKDSLQEVAQPAVRLAPNSKSARRGLRSP
jgi:hypothetical protein